MQINERGGARGGSPAKPSVNTGHGSVMDASACEMNRVRDAIDITLQMTEVCPPLPHE